MKAIDQLKEEFVSMAELCSFFGMEEKRVRDLISLHKNDGKFMRAFKVSAGHYYFHLDDVRDYIMKQATTLESETESS